MVLDEKEIKREARPANSGEPLNGKIEAQEGDESRIRLLQWYLKMILDSDSVEDPKIKKRGDLRVSHSEAPARAAD